MTWPRYLVLLAACFGAGFVGALAFFGYDAAGWIAHYTRRH